MQAKFYRLKYTQTTLMTRYFSAFMQYLSPNLVLMIEVTTLFYNILHTLFLMLSDLRYKYYLFMIC